MARPRRPRRRARRARPSRRRRRRAGTDAVDAPRRRPPTRAADDRRADTTDAAARPPTAPTTPPPTTVPPPPPVPASIEPIAAARRARSPPSAPAAAPRRRGSSSACSTSASGSPAPTGQYGLTTRQAVMAFQKYVGLPADGDVDDDTAAAPLQRHRAGPRATPTPARWSRSTRRASCCSSSSTGARSGSSTPRRATARRTRRRTRTRPARLVKGVSLTPDGLHKVNRERPEGWWEGDLGQIYRPKYFVGGVAVHGSNSVPELPGVARLRPGHRAGDGLHLGDRPDADEHPRLGPRRTSRSERPAAGRVPSTDTERVVGDGEAAAGLEVEAPAVQRARQRAVRRPRRTPPGRRCGAGSGAGRSSRRARCRARSPSAGRAGARPRPRCGASARPTAT